jgi:molybdopterin molybdotransferase
MLSVEAALERILGFFSVVEPEERPLLEALGQTLAEDVMAPLDIPNLANSAMDGFAVRHQDIAGAGPERPRELRVIGQVAAGAMPDRAVTPGTAVRIMTGAPIPEGADTVVPFEETDEVQRKAAGLGLERVAVLGDVGMGANVRPAGEDVRRGELVLGRGTVLRPSELGVLASLGQQRVRVVRRPSVAILATGDELTAPGEPLAPGRLYDSNSYTVAAAVQRTGGVPRLLGIARDNMEDMTAKLELGLSAEMLITTAGVSRGDYDMVKDILAERGEIAFWSVRMRPAKPLAFGVLNAPDGRRVPHVGLPGNPVSAMMAFEQFCRPAILKMLGRTRLARPTVRAVLKDPIRNTDGRRVYARAIVTREGGQYVASLTGPQGSNILTSMSKANGLAICPEDVPEMLPGQLVEVQMLDWPEEVIA